MNKYWAIIKTMQIHPLFWLIALIAVVTAHFIDLFMLFFIVFIHEIGHALAAVFFSWEIKRIQLLPFGGVAEFHEGGVHSLKEELIVVLSGPFQHVWLISVAFFLHQFSFLTEHTFHLFLHYNWMIVLFNLLPIYPLDGGRLMNVFFCYLFPYIVALRWSIYVSFTILVLSLFLLVIFFPFHINGWLIFFFLLFSLYKEWKNIPYIFIRFLLDRYGEKKEKRRKIKKIYVTEETAVQTVVSRFFHGKEHAIVFENDEKRKVHEKDFLKRFFERKPTERTMRELFS
ncbi:M50 family metallopeptidase [Fervidibacillus albus]|uniref:M50 family metallopeptidase n=1 Tax=Fervidibacillus albus TaxID=2980026 RepID=A0A9E8LVB0_9BACI|nr:M50 family metallopeptidase [Fervidibacillus albus]WAA10249.1 M50 family metallopeptidase [Fervidibacillus albus]